MENAESNPWVILVVEDNSSHAMLLHRAFKRSIRPCRLVDARTLREARECLNSMPIDLIVADFVLPDGKGTELLENSSMAQIYPVVILTAFGDERLAAEVIKRGAMDYMVKTPEAMVSLPQTVERVMREWQLRFDHGETKICLSNARSELEAMDRQLRLERKRSNRLALQAHAADVAKGVFLANISHEIRTPMNAVLGFSRLALGLPDLPQEARRYLATIESRAQDLLRMIDNAVEMARLEAEQLELSSSLINVRAMVAKLFETLKIKAEAKGLLFKSNVQPDVPVELIGDLSRLEQVLFNLLDNAIKFTEHGSVELSVGVVKSDMKRNGAQMLRFEVRDTGPGIHEGKRHLLFGLFSQIESVEMRRHSGLGLGLAVAKRLVERMGGEIGILESSENGSVFFFTASFEFPTEEPSSVCGDGGRRSASILVAEDDSDCSSLLKAMLTKHGYFVHSEPNGAEALRVWEGGKFDLVFTDLRMPTMDGFEFTRAIRAQEHERGGHVPVVAITACVVEEEEVRCMAAGMDDCVAKPFSENDLLNVMTRYIPA